MWTSEFIQNFGATGSALQVISHKCKTQCAMVFRNFNLNAQNQPDYKFRIAQSGRMKYEKIQYDQRNLLKVK